MIWVIAFFIIILISSVLAYRSMRDYEEFPDILSLNSLYFIGNPSNLTPEVIKRLHDFFVAQKQFFSLEKLIKGKEKARILYGPRDLGKDFPELNLVEIEDYLAGENEYSPDSAKKTNVNQALTWLIEAKNNPKKNLVVGSELNDLTVEENQKVFLQSVLMPIEKSEPAFQATLRVMVVDPDPIKRIELARKIDQLLKTATGLNKHEDAYPEIKKYESFKQRSLVPKEVSEFLLSSTEVASLMA